MQEYDEKILQRYADRLYSTARWLTVTWAVAGALLCWLLTWIPLIVWGWRQNPELAAPIISRRLQFGAALIGAVIFGAIGEAKGFGYKLRAQNILCQMQIERNTRRTV